MIGSSVNAGGGAWSPALDLRWPVFSMSSATPLQRHVILHPAAAAGAAACHMRVRKLKIETQKMSDVLGGQKVTACLQHSKPTWGKFASRQELLQSQSWAELGSCSLRRWAELRVGEQSCSFLLRRNLLLPPGWSSLPCSREGPRCTRKFANLRWPPQSTRRSQWAGG